MTAISAHGWLNLAIAMLGALVAFGAANRMSKETECTIIIAFATVGAGLVAWAAGTFLPADSWQQAFETLLLGGIVALLIGTRRQTIWLQPRLMPRISLAVSGATWAAFFLTVA